MDKLIAIAFCPYKIIVADSLKWIFGTDLKATEHSYIFSFELALKAAQRTQNATGGMLKDNAFIVGLNPQAGSPVGWYLRDNRGPLNMAIEDWILRLEKSAGFQRVARYPLGGLGDKAKLNTAFNKPKNSQICYFKKNFKPFWF